ncbi:unnamed protein product [Colias eurytheme]|nr:unnamed protein product [Colias eurytheme]
MRHDAAAVLAHILPLIEFVELLGKIDSIHFQSDSPSSQYRNKTMFYIISKLYWYYTNLRLVTWNYTEAGHGKGAADGIGGTVKRLADAAVAHGNNIVSIDDFVSVVTYSTASIIIKIIEEHKIFENDLIIPSDQLQPLKGTNKVHQVVWGKEQNNLIFRETSCFVCYGVDCNHTEHIGVLKYNNGNQQKLLITGQPKDIVITKPPKYKVRPEILEPNSENVRITSDLIIKPASKSHSEVTKLSDITADSKMHLENISINEMVNMYNVSGIEANFSGAFENFVRSKTSIIENPSTDEKSCAHKDDSDSDSDKIFIIRRKSSTEIKESELGKVDTKNIEPNDENSPPFVASTDNLQAQSKPNRSFFNLSDSEDELDVYPRKKVYFAV